MNKHLICGIQQMGIGVPNVHQAFDFYNNHFGTDVPVFDDAGTAELMLRYTNGKPQKRHAILALNLRGGGGFEIWQYTNRNPIKADFDIEIGDWGITACKIKTENAEKSYLQLKAQGKMQVLSAPLPLPNGKLHFFVRDAFENLFDITETDSSEFYQNGKRINGGVSGACIGVKDMEKSMAFYKEVLGYDEILFDKEGEFEDTASFFPENENKKYRRVLLTHKADRKGPFSLLLGKSYIELYQNKETEGRSIYKGRQWGDLGFIHLCFDVKNMESLKENCARFGSPFTVDTAGDFDMGVAAGRFAYTEDPNGTLIEFVETFKIPILEKFAWFIDLRKRDIEKPLPKIIIKAMGLKRKKS